MQVKSITAVVLLVCAFAGGWYVAAQVSPPPLPRFSSGQILTAASLNVLVDRIESLEARIENLEAKLAHVHLFLGEFRGLQGPHLVFEGVNVHVRSGSGTTAEENIPLTGLGNLLIGYNEVPPSGLAPGDRGGSHNLVVGEHHRFHDTGGFVAGSGNTVSGHAASVSSGRSNTASGDFASVSGGQNNTASGDFGSVSAGSSNEAHGNFASVSGGSGNVAFNDVDSVVGDTGKTFVDRLPVP